MSFNPLNKVFKSIILGISSGSVLIAETNEQKNIQEAITNNALENNTNRFGTNIVQTNQKFSKIHSCSGKNICRGLGGCNVTEKQLIKQALKMGLDIKDRKRIGVPHGCYGLNECKGLGGCKVTEKKFKMMQRRKRFYTKKRKAILEKYYEKQKETEKHFSSSSEPATNNSSSTSATNN